MVVERCYRKYCCENIHPTQKFISMNLLQMSCVVTKASEVKEAVRGQKQPSEAKKGKKELIY